MIGQLFVAAMIIGGAYGVASVGVRYLGADGASEPEPYDLDTLANEADHLIAELATRGSRRASMDANTEADAEADLQPLRLARPVGTAELESVETHAR